MVMRAAAVILDAGPLGVLSNPRPSADGIDGDIILAAQTRLQGPPNSIVATTNISHLRRFVDARLWSDIDG